MIAGTNDQDRKKSLEGLKSIQWHWEPLEQQYQGNEYN